MPANSPVTDPDPDGLQFAPDPGPGAAAPSSGATGHPAQVGVAPERPDRLGLPTYSAQSAQLAAELAAARSKNDADLAVASAGADGQQASADVLGDAAAEHRGQAVEYSDAAAQAADDKERLRQHAQAALDEAKNYTIPDFWDGKEGRHVASGILSGLAGLFGGPEGAAAATSAVNANVNAYFQREQAKLENLRDWAAKTGNLDAARAHDIDSRLATLTAKYGFVNDSIRDHLQQVVAQGASDTGRATAQTIAASLDANTAAAHASYMQQMEGLAKSRSSIQLQHAEAAADYAKAAHEKADGGAEAEAKADEKLYTTYAKGREGQAKDWQQRIDRLSSAKDELAEGQAVTPLKLKEAVVNAIAASAPGGKRAISQGELHQLLPTLFDAKDQISSKWHQLSDGTVPPHALAIARELVQQHADSAVRARAAEADGFAKSLAAQVGYTPERAKAHAMRVYGPTDSGTSAPVLSDRARATLMAVPQGDPRYAAAQAALAGK